MSGIKTADRFLRRRHARSAIFKWTCAAAAYAGLILLGVLLVSVAANGIPSLSFRFLTSFPSRFPSEAGIRAALWGSVWLVILTTGISVPVGIGAGIYLEEFSKKNWWARLVQINVSNLAGVPSIVFGILGLALFVRALALGRSLIAGALTMSLLILPTIVTSVQEALRAVPNSVRLASFALGGTRWRTVKDHTLPAALPECLTGVILAVSRAMGETAPLIMIGALTYMAFTPTGPMDAFTALPVQIFNWTSRPQAAFHDLAAAAIIVLLAVLLTMNALAIVFRIRTQKRQRW